MASDDIQGKITDVDGNAISGATVYLFSQDNTTEVTSTVTDSNGNYIFGSHPDGDSTTQNWHVVAEYDDGSNYYNTYSKPYVDAQLSSVLPDSVVSRDADDRQRTSQNAFGVQIETSQEWPQIGAELSSQTTADATTAYVYRVSDSNLMGSTDISSLTGGDTFTVDLDTSLAANETFNFVIDAGGNSHTFGADDNPSFPYTSSDGNLSITNGAQDAASTFDDACSLIRVGNVGF
jgi:hypothetical protein